MIIFYRYALEKRMRKLYSEEKDIKSLPDSALFRNKDEEYDWMMIAAKVFKPVSAPVGPRVTCGLLCASDPSKRLCSA